MDTVTWNWVWFALVFTVGAYLLFKLRHPSGRGSDPAKDDAPPHSPWDEGRRGAPLAPRHRSPSPVIDPVTGESVCSATAAAFFYQGRVYFFASACSRERFEAAPQAYLKSRNDGTEGRDPTIDRAGRAQPARTRSASTGEMRTRGRGEARRDSPEGRRWKQQGARDGR